MTKGNPGDQQKDGRKGNPRGPYSGRGWTYHRSMGPRPFTPQPRGSGGGGTTIGRPRGRSAPLHPPPVPGPPQKPKRSDKNRSASSRGTAPGQMPKPGQPKGFSPGCVPALAPGAQHGGLFGSFRLNPTMPITVNAFFHFKKKICGGFWVKEKKLKTQRGSPGNSSTSVVCCFKKPKITISKPHSS